METESGTTPAGDGCTELGSLGSVRVPLELEGSIWSAQVEQVSDGILQLVVDRDALARRTEGSAAAIHYQPDNCSMQCVSGTVKPTKPLSDSQVLVEFSLS